MTVYAQPGQEGAKVTIKSGYENWIGGQWVAPGKSPYFTNVTPTAGTTFTDTARGSAQDIEVALDAAHKAAPAWGKTPVADRALDLIGIADRIMDNLELLAVPQTWDDGKPIRKTLAGDIPLAADHFRYFAGAIGAQEGSLSQIEDDTTAYHYHEPLGAPGQILAWSGWPASRTTTTRSPSPTTPSTAWAPTSGPATATSPAAPAETSRRAGIGERHSRLPGARRLGGYTSGGSGRENHLMMLDHYQQTKNLLVSHCENKLGIFQG
jgi:acyl-CoA reductase-like NAD-dependent aldehyde dehydrogenase